MEQAPLWSLDSLYLDFTHDSHREDFAALAGGVAAVSGLIEQAPPASGTLSEKADWLLKVIAAMNELLDRYESLGAYAYTRYSTDTRDEAAVKGLGAIEEAALPLKAAGVDFRNRLAETAGNELDAIIDGSPELEPYRFVLGELLNEQRHQMSPAEESLAADLSRSGAEAWSRLQEAVSSTITAPWDEESGEGKTVIELRALAYHADRDIRERAWRKEVDLWKLFQVPLCAALNGVKGTTVTLAKRRGYRSVLEKSLDQSRITAATLDALIGVMEDSLPMFRRYLGLKARALGVEWATFFDLFAPIDKAAKVWTFAEAREFIVSQFAGFHPAMGSFAERAFESSWIDARPRPGKVGGAYCIGFPLQKESRVLCNFDGSLSAVSTIAHELGHAYHGYILRDQPAMLSDYPMTLAETASIFAETIVFNGALTAAPDSEKLLVIETFLQESTQVIVDILSRFHFERELFEAREAGELTPEQLCGMMLAAQKRTYGEGLDETRLHPYMWAVKGHYYRPELSFYNFPYAFGQLFGLSLYARSEAEGSDFCRTYDHLLLMTGRRSANEVTRAAGVDIERPEFWQSGIAVIERFVESFAALVDSGRNG